MTPKDLQNMTLGELIHVCLTDPQHVALVTVEQLVSSIYGEPPSPLWANEVAANGEEWLIGNNVFTEDAP